MANILRVAHSDTCRTTHLSSTIYPAQTIKVTEYPNPGNASNSPLPLMDLKFVWTPGLGQSIRGPLATKLIDLCVQNGIPIAVWEGDDRHGSANGDVLSNWTYEKTLNNLADVVKFSHQTHHKIILGGLSLGGQTVQVVSSLSMMQKLGRPDVASMIMGTITCAPAIGGLRMGYHATIQKLNQGSEDEKAVAQMIESDLFVKLGHLPFKKSMMLSEAEYEIDLASTDPIDSQAHYCTILAGGFDTTVPSSIPVKLFTKLKKENGASVVVRDETSHLFSSDQEFSDLSRELLKLVGKVEAEDLQAHARLGRLWSCKRSDNNALTLTFKKDGHVEHSIPDALAYEQNSG